MVKIVCQFTGIEFEAATKRSKNHPRISNLLNEANRDGWYSAALDSIKKNRGAGVKDIKEFVAAAYSAKEAYFTKKDADFAAQAEAVRKNKEQMEAAKEARIAQNNFLREHGYHWSKTGYSSYDAYEEGGPDEWELIAADGRLVEGKAAQALDEIERGVEVVLAEIQAKKAEKTRKEAQEIAAKEAGEAERTRQRSEYEAKVTEVKATCKEVEPPVDPETGWAFGEEKLVELIKGELIASYRHGYHNQYSDRLYMGSYNGIACYVNHFGDSYDFDGVTQFWCANPEKANLKIKD